MSKRKADPFALPDNNGLRNLGYWAAMEAEGRILWRAMLAEAHAGNLEAAKHFAAALGIHCALMTHNDMPIHFIPPPPEQE